MPRSQANVDHQLAHIALLTVVLLVIVTIDDIIRTVVPLRVDVAEVAGVARVCTDLVPCDAFEVLLGHLLLLELLFNAISQQAQAIDFVQIFALFNQPFGLG